MGWGEQVLVCHIPSPPEWGCPARPALASAPDKCVINIPRPEQHNQRPYLHDVGPELRLLVSALDLGDLQDPRGQGEVVHSPAGAHGGGDDGGLGHQVHGHEVGHPLKH